MLNYRHKTRHATVSVDGLDIFYRHAGDPEGPAILLLHGYPASPLHVPQHHRAISGSRPRVAPDLPSFGYSSVPSADTYDYTFGNIASWSASGQVQCEQSRNNAPDTACQQIGAKLGNRHARRKR